MIAKALAGAFRTGVLAFAIVALASPAQAQRAPSANAIALAKEIVTVKGAASMYEPVIAKVIDQARLLFMQTNPMLSKDLNEVAAQLRAGAASRSVELLNLVAKHYAAQFTEQELKDALAFYKSPLGRKIIVQEPQILDQSVSDVDAWAGKFSDEIIAKFRAEMRKRGHDV